MRRVLMLMGALLLAIPLVGGCAAPALGEDEHHACELEPQALSSLGGYSEVETEEGTVGTAREELSSLSCKMSATTGYTSGKSFPIKVVTIDGKKVEWKTANAYMRMAQAAAKDGVQIRIVSGFRSMSEQQYLYNCYKTCSCNSCNLAAAPGYSNHQSGHALDLNTSSAGVYNWLAKHGGKFGFKRTVPSEAWHWEWWGSDTGQGPCNGDTLKANVTKRWSSARRYRGKNAHYIACAGDSFKLSFTLANKGTAVWRDVAGRGKKIGNDVFLETASGKTDKLTGKKRFSVKLNKNAVVRGDRNAKSCSDKNGCRRTTFIKGAMKAKAPAKSGIYTTRWRLRDRSAAWGKSSKGFGPKTELRVKVIQCEQPKAECGCRVWCSDGKSHKLAANITSASMCKSVAQTYCSKPAAYLDHSFQKCASTGTGGTGGTGGSSSSGGSGSTSSTTSTDSGGSEWPSLPGDDDAEDGDPGSEEDPSTVAEDGAGEDDGEEDAPGGYEDDGEGVGTEEPDDEDFVDDGYDGGDVDAADPDAAAEACSVRGAGAVTGSGAWLALALLVLGGAVRRRRRSQPRSRCAGLLVVLPLLLFALGCGAPDAGPEAASSSGALSGESPLVPIFQEASRETGVPAELLATISWLQARLSMNTGDHEEHAHGAPHEWGLMAIGSAGLLTLEQAAAEARVTPGEAAVDPRANVRAAAAWLAAEAQRQGLSPARHEDWAPVLDRYGGEELSSPVLRLLATGWVGSDDDELDVEVTGTAPIDEGDELGVLQEGLGYPGGKWSPASSSNYTNSNRGKADIRYVVIHTTQGSYSGAISWFKNPASNVSSHYVVRSSDGHVTQMVDDRDVAWHDACFNTNSIGIEHEGFVESPKKWYTDAMYRSSARLTSWLCDKYGIPKDRKHIMGHGETPDCSTHTDPGSGWDWNKYMSLVKSGGKVTKTLKAKSTKKWSNKQRFRGKAADYIACAGEPVKLGFTFKNTGSATWRDVEKRGKSVGSDVFLVTADGKKDKLTGRIRYSLRNNQNDLVRGDRNAKDCVGKRGCRRTRFIEGSMLGAAPKKPGVYSSRWRLRDYSAAWGKQSKGFGPKVAVKLKVVSCELPTTGCGCRVWCTDGKSQKLASTITSNAMCKSVAQTACKPAAYLKHDYVACAAPAPTPPSSGPNETGGGSGAGGESSAGGAGGASGSEGEGEAGETESDEEETDDNGWTTGDLDEDEDAIEEEDDAEFDDHGFTGDADADDALGDEAPGCALSPTGSRGQLPAGTAAGLVLAAAALLRARRRRLGAARRAS
ncbi:MAG: N-acetylmuramoyl-L-alanine amidase [Polyangiaceae bacterium]|nr:N-acetylmuramoyl-L-alanine amidase [Polyangiaceae bacterium]